MTSKQVMQLRKRMQQECANCPRELDTESYTRGVERVLDELENIVELHST